MVHEESYFPFPRKWQKMVTDAEELLHDVTSAVAPVPLLFLAVVVRAWSVEWAMALQLFFLSHQPQPGTHSLTLLCYYGLADGVLSGNESRRPRKIRMQGWRDRGFWSESLKPTTPVVSECTWGGERQSYSSRSDLFISGWYLKRGKFTATMLTCRLRQIVAFVLQLMQHRTRQKSGTKEGLATSLLPLGQSGTVSSLLR